MKAQDLKKVDIFSGIDKNTLADLIATNDIYSKNYSKGATIHKKDDECSGLDIVESGKLIAYALAENGSMMTMFEFASKSLVGANLLFADNDRYPLNIYCLSDSKVLYATKKAVSECLHDYNFVMHYIKALSLNSQSMNKKISMMTQKTLRENILAYIWQLSIKQDSSVVVLPISKKELADYLGVQRPSLFRELKKLKEEDIIDIKNREIRIIKRNGE